MRNLDFSPLYRSTIGFDRLASLLDNVSRSEQGQPSYPPYDIELTGEDSYQISMAVAGFAEQELSIQVDQNLLTVTGSKQESSDGRKYLHKGIAARNFERRFQLADHVRVENARIENGLLHIALKRELPESMKPREIKISSGEKARLVKDTEQSAA